jgi:hypothetical protein
LRPEAKFEKGDYLDSGPTRRRHVQVAQINYIGKEANRWEEQFFLAATLADDQASIRTPFQKATLPAIFCAAGFGSG